GHRIRVPPVPIPNTEVKPDTADGTAWETVWESRSLPALSRQRPDRFSMEERSGLSYVRATSIAFRAHTANSEALSSTSSGTAWYFVVPLLTRPGYGVNASIPARS